MCIFLGLSVLKLMVLIFSLWYFPWLYVCVKLFICIWEHFHWFGQPVIRSNGGVWCTVYPKKYAHGFCFAVLCCGYTLTDFPISIRLTSLALWQSNDCPSASKATLMNMDKYFMWIHYERLRNHNKAKHNKTVCIFLGIYCNHYSNVALESWCPKSFARLLNSLFRQRTKRYQI